MKLCHLEIVAGQSSVFKAVSFLICDDKKINAHGVYEGLPTNLKRHLQTSFDYWIMGKPNNKRYHGWDKSSFGGAYVYCFVFKCLRNRFYGFLCHPNSRNLRYQLCVLVIHDEKDEHETDETNLKHVEEIRNDPLVRTELKKLF
jgi:hypothetical protein